MATTNTSQENPQQPLEIDTTASASAVFDDAVAATPNAAMAVPIKNPSSAGFMMRTPSGGGPRRSRFVQGTNDGDPRRDECRGEFAHRHTRRRADRVREVHVAKGGTGTEDEGTAGQVNG